MAKKLYVSDNYIIADFDNGTITEYPRGQSDYSEKDGNFTINEDLGDGKLVIAVSAAATWDNSAGGGTPYSAATLRTFLRQNTGFSLPGTFESLADVPGYAGNANKHLAINATEDGLDAVVPPVAGNGFLYYMVTIDQAGVLAPTVDRAVVNTTGATWTYQYDGIGDYSITSDSAIDITKVFAQVGNNSDALLKPTTYVDSFGNASVSFEKFMLDGAVKADGLTDVTLQIIVVP